MVKRSPHPDARHHGAGVRTRPAHRPHRPHRPGQQGICPRRRDSAAAGRRRRRRPRRQPGRQRRGRVRVHADAKEEFLDMFFEDLELPDLVKKNAEGYDRGRAGNGLKTDGHHSRPAELTAVVAFSASRSSKTRRGTLPRHAEPCSILAAAVQGRGRRAAATAAAATGSPDGSGEDGRVHADEGRVPRHVFRGSRAT